MRLALTISLILLQFYSFSQTETSARYIKGEPAWRRFLEQMTSERDLDACFKGAGDSLTYKAVKLSFEVNTDSGITNVQVFQGNIKSLCLTLKFSRILMQAEKIWIPAQRNGIPYASTVEQKLTICWTEE